MQITPGLRPVAPWKHQHAPRSERAEVPRHAGEGRGLRPAGPARRTRATCSSSAMGPARTCATPRSQTIAERLADAGIATFRYNFPYMEHGKGRDSQAVCTATVRSAVAAAHQAAPDLPLLAGGHSFGGRMTSTAASESPLEGVRGLVFFAFPLHQPGKPDTKRAEHLAAVTVPMLFLSGTRDELAEHGPPATGLQEARQARDAPPLDTADHGYKVAQTLPHERGGRLRRDGPRRPGVGVPG